MAVTVEALALEVGRAFEPLKDRLVAGEVKTLFVELGMPTPDVVLGAPGVTDAIGNTATALEDLPPRSRLSSTPSRTRTSLRSWPLSPR